jgi:hypothetical protein
MSRITRGVFIGSQIYGDRTAQLHSIEKKIEKAHDNITAKSNQIICPDLNNI